MPRRAGGRQGELLVKAQVRASMVVVQTRAAQGQARDGAGDTIGRLQFRRTPRLACSLRYFRLQQHQRAVFHRHTWLLNLFQHSPPPYHPLSQPRRYSCSPQPPSPSSRTIRRAFHTLIAHFIFFASSTSSTERPERRRRMAMPLAAGRSDSSSANTTSSTFWGHTGVRAGVGAWVSKDMDRVAITCAALTKHYLPARTNS